MSLSILLSVKASECTAIYRFNTYVRTYAGVQTYTHIQYVFARGKQEPCKMYQTYGLIQMKSIAKLYVYEIKYVAHDAVEALKLVDPEQKRCDEH